MTPINKHAINKSCVPDAVGSHLEPPWGMTHPSPDTVSVPSPPHDPTHPYLPIPRGAHVQWLVGERHNTLAPLPQEQPGRAIAAAELRWFGLRLWLEMHHSSAVVHSPAEPCCLPQRQHSTTNFRTSAPVLGSQVKVQPRPIEHVHPISTLILLYLL